jgi:hypothetical protein
MHSIESNFPQEEKKMKKSIMGLSLVAAIATFGSELPVQNGTSDDNIQLVIAVDNSGLNSNRCSSLFKSNMDEINHILHRKSIKTMKLNHLSVYVFNENIKHIGTVQEKKRGSFRRKSKEVLNDLKNELRVDTTKKSKDVWGVVKYLNILATNVNHKVVAVIFSNLSIGVVGRRRFSVVREAAPLRTDGPRPAASRRRAPRAVRRTVWMCFWSSHSWMYPDRFSAVASFFSDVWRMYPTLVTVRPVRSLICL